MKWRPKFYSTILLITIATSYGILSGLVLAMKVPSVLAYVPDSDGEFGWIGLAICSVSVGISALSRDKKPELD